MSTTQYLQDVTTRHQIFLERFGNGRSKEANSMLSRLRRKINARLAMEPTEFHRDRLKVLLDEVEALSKITFGQISEKVILDVGHLAPVEASYSAELFGKVTKMETGYVIPADSLLVAAALQTGMSAGVNSGVNPVDALRKFGDKKTAQIMTAISDGVSLGLSTPDISKEVGGIMGRQQPRQLRSLINTIVSHTSSISRNEIYKANDKYIEGFRWISTLDSSTTFVCMKRDQEVYRVGIDPMPPAHYNCRSTTIPAIIGEKQAGNRATGKRPSFGGERPEQVNNNLSYGQWLKKQPKEFVDEALGVERSKLFRSGQISLDKFSDPTGRVYTLRELDGMKPISMIET